LHELAASVPAETIAGNNHLRDVMAVAEPVVAARIAASAGHDAETIALLGEAVAAEDKLAYDEPAEWFFPVRHLLGAQLLLAGSAAEAERVYREDLKRNPANGWALYGLAAALRAQGRAGAAAPVAREFARAWKHADIELPASAFWFAGADTSRCACEYGAADPGAAGGKLRSAPHEAGVH